MKHIFYVALFLALTPCCSILSESALHVANSESIPSEPEIAVKMFRFPWTGSLNSNSLVWGVCAVLCGCSPAVITPTSEFEVATGTLTKDLTTIVVLGSASNDVSERFGEIDVELARFVSFRLAQDGHDPKIVNCRVMREWADEKDAWSDPIRIAKKFDAQYIIGLEFHALSLYDGEDRSQYRGRAHVEVSVRKVNRRSNPVLFEKRVLWEYPRAELAPLELGLSEDEFRRTCLSKLSSAIGELFYENLDQGLRQW